MSRVAHSCADHVRYTRGCPGCQAVSRAYRRKRLQGLKDGTWTPGFVGAEELERVRSHVNLLMAVRGISAARISAVAGVGMGVVDRLRNGRTERLSTPVAEALMGVTVRACLRLISVPTTPVDITGTARRLRALAADGWSANEISALTGIHPSAVRRHRGGSRRIMITWALREKYRELYEKIQSQADPSGPSEWTRLHAARLGYLPPERWDDKKIDDPAAEPLPLPPETDDWVAVTQKIEAVLISQQPGSGAHLERNVKRELARHAASRLGWPYGSIALVLGYKSTGAVEYLLHGRKDRPHTRRKS
jgi:hypothetical protein